MADTSFASHALALSAQHWMDLGRGSDPMTGVPDTIEEAASRITHLLVIRIIALHLRSRFDDLATSTIARAILTGADPASITKIIEPSWKAQLENYVACMLNGYKNNLPFHNYQHAYHVCITANKFLESMLISPNSKVKDVYGLASNPLQLLALIFAALIHDVGHTGVSNFQRAKDEPDLAKKYEDASIHEHHSICIAFEELDKEQYSDIRAIMFPQTSQYDTFRKLVADAVLSTDIANPYRADIAKLKFFEAFPVSEYDEDPEEAQQRRYSLTSDISMPRAHTSRLGDRRISVGTANSFDSDYTPDSYPIPHLGNKSSRHTPASNARRSSISSEIKVPRRLSVETNSSNYSEFAADSICMTGERVLQRRASTGNHGHRRSSVSNNTDASILQVMAQEVRRGSLLETVRRYSMTEGVPPKRSGKSSFPNPTTGESGIGDLFDYGSDSDLSVSPPGSNAGDELDGVVITGITKDWSTNPAEKEPPGPIGTETATRRVSTGRERSLSSTLDPSKIRAIEEEILGEFNDVSGNFELDDSLENLSTMTVAFDNTEDLQAVVALELCLRAADVGHWYQSWDTMTHFNRRIFRELCEASRSGHGFDPVPNWFDNQVKIMETYLLPLAEQIQHINIIGKGSGIDLVASLESNNDLWLVKGLDVVDALKAELN